MRSFGARRDRQLKYLDFPAALPAIASGAKLAAPTALIGIIIGEWFGAPRGLGVLVINAMQNFQIPLLWSAVLLAVITSIVLFVLLGWIERRVAEYFR
jgi:NitT/TauT family transport system permease protein